MAEIQRELELETIKENVDSNSKDPLNSCASDIPCRPKIRRGLANLIAHAPPAFEVKTSDAVYTKFDTKSFDNEALRQKWLANNSAKEKLLGTFNIPYKTTPITRSRSREDVVVVRDDSPSPPPPTETDPKVFAEINSLIRQRQAAKEYYAANQKIVESPGKSAISSPMDSSSTAEEMTVKLRWKGVTRRIPMKMTQPFHTVISELARQSNVVDSRVMLCLNDNTIPPHETPRTRNLTIADIIEGYLVAEGETVDIEEPDDLMELKVQSKTSKAPKSYKIRKCEPLSVLATQYAKDNDCPVDKLSFKFDGDVLDLQSSPEDLDLEDGFCIDVRVFA